jgi:CheY-like chemotaxis protein
MRASGSVQVLIAEDDPRIREALVILAQALGHAATSVCDGAQALRAVSARLPDLILSDVEMPELNGLELCRRLKADPATRRIPVVLFTALGDSLRRAALDAGADGFLVKPFGMAEVEMQIQTVLARRR